MIGLRKLNFSLSAKEILDTLNSVISVSKEVYLLFTCIVLIEYYKNLRIIAEVPQEKSTFNNTVYAVSLVLKQF